MSIWPLACTWTGEAFEPLRRFHNVANANLVVGQVYALEGLEERSAASHRHYFAQIKEVWLNLPESAAEQFPTPEHLRKFALIKTGHRDERTFVASSKAEAIRLAAFLRPVDEFSIVVVRESTVVVWTAQSQALRAMGKETFQKSKDDVLEYIAGLIEVKPKELERMAAA